jgi:hypothetical protein
MTDNTTPTPDLSAPPTDAAWAGVLTLADPWLSKRETAAFRGVSISTLDRMIRLGLFPAGEATSPGRRGWRLSVVRAAEAAPFTPKGGREPRKVHDERAASAHRGGKLRKADGGRT